MSTVLGEAADWLEKTEHAKWSTPREATRMGKSGYAPRKGELAQWVVEGRSLVQSLVKECEALQADCDRMLGEHELAPPIALDTGHDNARLAHRAAYVEWRYTGRFGDAISRDNRRRDLHFFGYTPEQIREIEIELDKEHGFSGS